MSKSVLVMNTPENCYDCPFGTEYCGNLEYEGCCELADCLDYDVILMTEEHYDYESKSRPEWCPLKPLPEKMIIPRGARNTDGLEYASGYNTCINEIKGGEVDD
jgi:hypothetical protein|nr:MAG TPA_asm: hypothetical protein [Caudoviricetes sp.]